ncbi:MAG: methylenetetrahydrofolate reductase [NAD(P)H] [Caulobacterales bacterium]|nr:methylenetetrahydrofolate reductase [NAD(P)H] [Caulobacterales bacterium]
MNETVTLGDGSDSPLRLPRDERTRTQVSFELFPPKTPKMEERLWSTVERLAPLAPSYFSVTYGAGGSTRAKTFDTVMRLHKETGVPVAAHLTCVGASRGEIDDIARSYWDAGIRHIVALRGDAPDEDGYRPHPDGYPFAADLVAGLRRIADFQIDVAAYPEEHPEARSLAADIDSLKRKQDAGAAHAITQYFFDNEAFLRFRDRARVAGVTMPIVPGVMPIVNFAQIDRFSAMCGAHIPMWLRDMFDGLEDEPQMQPLVAAPIVAEQCKRLREEGESEFHFYTLNRGELSYAAAHLLGLRPSRPRPDGADAS